jgi:iron complex transport system permease protein
MKEAGLRERYQAVAVKRIGALFALGAAVIVSFGLDLGTGPANLTWLEVAQGMLQPSTLSHANRIVLWDIRLPDALMAVAVGAALALGGVETQTVLNNPLASPFTLGLSSAAALGASAAIALRLPILGLPPELALPALAFLAAVAAGGVILFFSSLYGGSSGTVILFGIALLFLCDALTSILQFVSSDEAVRQIVFWRMGDLTRAGWKEVGIVALVLAATLPLSLRASAALTAVRGGEELARGAGLRVERLRLLVVLRVSVLTAVAVCFVGAIGFVGLVGPHIARLILGEDHRYLVPGSALCGAMVLSLASFASKAAIPGAVVPVGITTAVVGVPLFVALVLTQRSAHI